MKLISIIISAFLFLNNVNSQDKSDITDNKKSYITPIHQINFTTTIIHTIKNGNELGTATGFFYKNNNTKYLVTNRHVVLDSSKNHYPNKLKLILHKGFYDSLNQNHDIYVSLFDKQGNELWIEHPNYSKLKCDIVAIPFNKLTLEDNNYIKFQDTKLLTFSSTQTKIYETNPFGDIVVVGYPKGIYDKNNNLPIYRKAMIASQYGVNFEAKPYFLIDAKLHPGTSGSPVVNSFHTLYTEKGTPEGYQLFGIVSAAIGLDLYVVWYSYLIDEIIGQ